MSKETKEVAAAKSTAVGLANMYEADAGGGFEQADETSYAIPFLSILQALSPQLNKQDGAYIKGAEQGQLINSATGEVFEAEEKGVMVIPCYFKRSFTHWAPRESGGGFLGEVSPSDPILNQTTSDGGALMMDDGTYFNDTRSHYVLIVDEEGNYTPALISMTATQIKKSRQWMTKMQNIKIKRADGTSFTPPMFSHFYRLTTVPESNNQGNWYGWKIETVVEVDDPALYSAAKAFRDSIVAGEVKVQQPGGSAEEFDSPDV